MLSNFSSGFGYVTGNIIDSQPQTGTNGTSITPGTSNSMGSYTEILSDTLVAYDCYGILIWMTGGSFTAEARNTLVTIGRDESGGTSYTDWIPTLCACGAGQASNAPGVWYYFPVYIKAGTALAAKAQTQSVNARSIGVSVWLFGQPDKPECLKYGQGVEAVGVDTANSAGTAVTSGTTSEGSWTSLGTTTRQCFYWQLGFGCNDSTMTQLTYHADLAADNDTTTPSMIMQDVIINTNAVEMTAVFQLPGWKRVASGQTIYGRLQCSGTADSNLSLAAYGVY